MSPILVRPVREQLEHDRVIRLLQAKYKRKFEVGINPGPSVAVPVGTGEAALYPDLVLQSTDRSRKLLGVVEVETSESVNHLEAMAQWARFGRLKAELHLYVPSTAIDTTRRLCTEFAVPAAEIWTYHSVGDEIRFTLIQRAAGAQAHTPKSATAAPAKKVTARAPAKKATPKAAPVKSPARKAVPAKAKAKAGTARTAVKVKKAVAPKRPAAKKASTRKR